MKVCEMHWQNVRKMNYEKKAFNLTVEKTYFIYFSFYKSQPLFFKLHFVKIVLAQYFLLFFCISQILLFLLPSPSFVISSIFKSIQSFKHENSPSKRTLDDFFVLNRFSNHTFFYLQETFRLSRGWKHLKFRCNLSFETSKMFLEILGYFNIFYSFKLS